MTEANAQPELPKEDVVRTRRIEVVDSSDRVRIEIGEHALPGTHEIRGFGITLRGPNGSVRADLTEDASGVRLAFLSSGNEVLTLEAEDAQTLMLDRGGDDLVYLPVGSPGNEVMTSGSQIVLRSADGTASLGWRLSAEGEVEHEESSPPASTGDGEPAASVPVDDGGSTEPACAPDQPDHEEISTSHPRSAEGVCPACALAEHFLNTLVRVASHEH